jgi:hypothetical protein
VNQFYNQLNFNDVSFDTSSHDLASRLDISQSVVDFYFNSVEYVFKYSTKMFSYDFELSCFDFMDNLDVVSSDFFFNSLIEICWELSAFQLFFSVVLDVINTNNIFKHFYSTEWYKLFISHQTYSLYLIHHPEFAFY